MKLFVWADPYPVSYGTSGYFAIAESVEQAREIARSAPGYSYIGFDKGGHMGNSADKLLAGEPTRIVDVPCGEWHEWSE